MGLSLLVGPANAGKVSRLLERYLEAIESDPYLIVPNRPDVDRAERWLLGRTGALFAGEIGTFDDLFRRVARSNGDHRPVVGDAQRRLLLRRVVARAAAGGSSRFAGFADALGSTVSELESALVEPTELEGELAELYGAYREELDRLGLWDRELERSYAAGRIAGELDAWDGRPVFAYGFEDLTGSEWALVEALAARGDLTVSLPYEPGRDAFASLSRTAEDLSALAGSIEELPADEEAREPVLAHLERSLFGEPAKAPPLDGSLRFLEGAGLRGTLELVAEEVLELLRKGTPAEQVAIVCPSLDRWRAALDTAFATYGVPYALEGRLRLGLTPFGQALLGLLRYAWLDGERRDLFAFLRSPYSGLLRRHADFLEGRLRGRGVSAPERIEEEIQKLRAQPLPQLAALRSAEDPVAALREAARALVEAAHTLQAPPTAESAQLDLRAQSQVTALADQLDEWRRLGGEVSREEIVALLEHETVRLAGSGEAGRVAVLDLLRARTRRFEVVFVLGLEEGRLPRRATGSPFLDEERKAELEESSRAGRLLRTDPVSRDRYLFYTA
ncbi:MAG: PD-(D/E)XK nuclease family protein, partial [Gaiellaceae bacterium]